MDNYDFYVNHGFLDSCVITPDNNIIIPAIILERIFGITSSEDVLRFVDMIEANCLNKSDYNNRCKEISIVPMNYTQKFLADLKEKMDSMTDEEFLKAYRSIRNPFNDNYNIWLNLMKDYFKEDDE